jgi:hypothetical protein
MLHTINKAWLKILVNQSVKDISKKFLFVAATDSEKYDTIDELWSILPEGGRLAQITVMSEAELKFEMMTCIYYNEDFPMYDAILISHSIHDIYIKDFLGRHCKRKGS